MLKTNVGKKTCVWLCVLGMLAMSLVSCSSAKRPDNNSDLPTGNRNSATREATASDTDSGNEAPADVSGNVSTVPYALVGFNYTLLNTGGGWNQGSMLLALENRSDSTVYPESLDFSRSRAVLQTAEGATYPVDFQSRIENGRPPSIMINGPIPPGFAVRAVGGNPDTTKYDLVLQWNSAEAATPSRIVFPDYPGLAVDIPAEQGIQYSFDSSQQFPAIQGGQGLKLLDNPEGLEIALNGECRPVELNNHAFGEFALGVSYTNNNQFQEVSIQNDLKAMQISVFDRDSGHQNFQAGADSTGEDGSSLFSLGPGQASSGEIIVGKSTGYYAGRNSVVVFWLPDGSHEIYDLSICGGTLAGSNESEPVAGRSGQIAYVVDGLVYAMDEDGSAQSLLSEFSQFENVNVAKWSPDGSKIAVVDGDYLFVLNEDGSGLKQLNSAGVARDVSWSPDGERLVTYLDDAGLYIINPEGRVLSALATTEDIVNDFREHGALDHVKSLEWSPDGSRIVFSAGDWENDLIYVVKPDGTGFSALGEGMYPTWSPDAKQIAYISLDDKLMIMNTDGSDDRALTDAGEDRKILPAWSPDGSHIIFKSYISGFGGGDKFGIFRIDTDGSGLRQLAEIVFVSYHWLMQAPVWIP